MGIRNQDFRKNLETHNNNLMIIIIIIIIIIITHLYSTAASKYPAMLNNLVAKTIQVKNNKIVVKILK